ncbi:MAG TPA: SDR family NAD(P)-dependent oxidoreductase [Candidatus Nanopelagicales bacterium]|nr:SDR family NAD(P)-dependent oxidoreductase [Candidatus Nanopelagicales bacterium]
MSELSGRRVLVTGGGSGIGRATCLAAIASGAAVVAVDRDEVALASTASLGPVSTVACDVTDEDALAAAVVRAAEVLGGPVDGLVCAAGVYDVVPALELEAARFDLIMRVNVLGSFLAVREMARGLRGSGTAGSVVLLSSIASERGGLREPGAHYAASKGAIVSLTHQLAVELADVGIRVNAVSPGVIRTPMLRLTDDVEAARATLDALPLHRLGEPDEVARACVHLLSDDASYTTGAVLAVDGGAAAS